MVQNAITNGPQIILRKTGKEDIGAAGLFGSCKKSLSLLVAPIKLGKQVLGVFSIQSYQSNAYIASDLNILNSVANQIAGALDRIRNASALADNEKQLSRVWETAIDGMALANAKGSIVQLNTAFAKIAAKPKSELLGNNLVNIYHPSVQGSIFNNYKNQFEKRESSGLLKQEVRLWNGKYRWIEMSNSFVDNNSKGILQLIVLRDVTEQEKFNQARTHAQRLESLGTLAGGIAHDLNNALAPITMSIELIQRRYPESCKLLKTVESSANRAADMVRRLLTFSRGSNEQPTNLQSRQLVDEIEKLILRTFPKNIVLKIKHHAGDCPIYGDATQLHQLLLNLCINARDAMPNGGRISIDTDLTAKAPPHSQNQKLKPGPFVVWRVSDTGCGIPEEAMHRIFEPYFTTKGPENGTGIGLSIVMGIAHSHGGCVEANSLLKKGSCFVVHLPVGEQTSKTEIEVPVSNASINGKGKTVLIVDDEPAVLELLSLLLAEMDFEVIAFSNGAEAQERICKKSNEISLIITDMHMPGMSGLQLSKNLRNIDIKIPIVLSSGRVEPNIAKAFKELEVHTVIHKPFKSLSLKEAIIRELAPD
jgi:PAS domain S-box-containing protein